MILEGIATTIDAEGAVNLAAMGPRVDGDWRRLVLRPFKTSATYQNLRHHGEGVWHVTDDVLMLAQSAVGAVDPPPLLVPATRIQGHIIQGACRFYEFRVRRVDESGDRAEIEAAVVASGRLRDFAGLSRAKHAVVEAAILASRLHFLDMGQIVAEFSRLEVLVEKTGGKGERQAFDFLKGYVQEHAPAAPEAPT